MELARELKLPLSEVFSMSVREIQLWQAFFLYKNDKTGASEQKSVKNKGKKYQRVVNINDERSVKALMSRNFKKDK